MDRTLVVVVRHLERNVQEPGGSTEAFVVLPEHDDAELAIGRPVAFEAFEDVQTARRAFASNMKRRVGPRAEPPAHVYEARCLERDHRFSFISEIVRRESPPLRRS